MLKKNIWIISEKNHSEIDFSIIYGGHEKNKSYIAELIFGNDYEEIQMGTKWIWNLGGMIKKNPHDCSLMILEVNTVERKLDKIFIGVNGGFNIHNEPAFYNLPLEVTLLRLTHKSTHNPQVYTIAGNINEALDIFAEDVMLPLVGEGDYLCFLNAGAYGASTSSDHCMRGQLSEYLLQ